MLIFLKYEVIAFGINWLVCKIYFLERFNFKCERCEFMKVFKK